MRASPSCLALVPARAGSKRVPGKNLRRLRGHPLLAYAVCAARASGVFRDVIVSTDSEEVARIAAWYGAETPFLRPPEMAGDLSPDIEWVRHALAWMHEAGRDAEAFALLRPTSPFRTAATIRRAWSEFLAHEGVDSLRAVEPCRQHPGKMWTLDGGRLSPLLAGGPADPPWHSTPYQALPRVYAQNASLEIAWTATVRETGSIAGTAIAAFVSEGHEGFDLNDRYDWLVAERLAGDGEAALPEVDRPPFPEPAP